MKRLNSSVNGSIMGLPAERRTTRALLNVCR